MSSSIEAVRDAFNFEIQKLPLSGPDNMRTPWYGLFRSDNGDLVTDASKTRVYVPHQTEDVVALAEAASSAFEGDCKIDCHFSMGHHMIISPSDQDRLSVFGENDNVFPRFVIKAPYNGRSFMASMGLYRDLCTNLTMLHTVRESHVNIRHDTGLPNKIEELTRTFSVLRESWATVTKVIEQMEESQVNVSEFLRLAVPPSNPEDPSTRYQNMIGAIIRRIRRENFRSGRSETDIHAESQISVWQAYNGVQGHIQHTSTRKGVPHDRIGEMNISRVISGVHDPRMKKLESVAITAISA
jgi:hypothetical protein